MEEAEQNKGSFDVINKIGKAKLCNETITEPQATSTNDPVDLAEMQQQYLWRCTFEVL